MFPGVVKSLDYADEIILLEKEKHKESFQITIYSCEMIFCDISF